MGVVVVGKVRYDEPCMNNIRVDRKHSPLGNPFFMKNEGMREEVCDKYEEYFKASVKKEGVFRDEVIRLYRLHKRGYNLNLQCWCAPKRCHADTIKRFIEQF